MLIWIVWQGVKFETSCAEGFFTNEQAANKYRDALEEEARLLGLNKYRIYCVCAHVVCDTAEEAAAIEAAMCQLAGGE